MRSSSLLATDPLATFNQMAHEIGAAAGPMRMMPGAEKFKDEIEGIVRARRSEEGRIDQRMASIEVHCRNISAGIRRLIAEGTLNLTTEAEDGTDVGFMRWMLGEEQRGELPEGGLDPRGIEIAILAWGRNPDGTMHDSGIHGHPNMGLRWNPSSSHEPVEVGGLVYDVIDGAVAMDTWASTKEGLVVRCQDKYYTPDSIPLVVTGQLGGPLSIVTPYIEDNGALLPHDVRPLKNPQNKPGEPDLISLHLYSAHTRYGKKWSYSDIEDLGVRRCTPCTCPNGRSESVA